MREIGIFWGCTIPARLPFVEKATRAVLTDLEWRVVEPSGLTCCPESQLVKTADEIVYYATAARNLALANEQVSRLMTPCSGCYSTFKETVLRLRSDRALRQVVERMLASVGRTLSTPPDVWHLAEWLCEEIGPDVLRTRLVRPLYGMRLAVHYGCHLLRPSPAVDWDHPLRPTKVERLLRALGATVLDYPSKLDCCGNGLERAAGKGSSSPLLGRKLDDLHSTQVDALIVVCPACFLQFDLGQVAHASTARRDQAQGRASIPIFYLTELLALALGHTPGELGLDMHRIPVHKFLHKWADNLDRRAELAKYFDLPGLETCASCRACDADCPAAAEPSDFAPSQVIQRLLIGELTTIIAGREPWHCLECMTCLERCHSRLGMAWIFERLKTLARQHGHVPAQIQAGYQSFVSTGIVGTARASVRENLGLPPLPLPDPGELREMLALVNSEPDCVVSASHSGEVEG